MRTELRPFKIGIDSEVLADLRARLARTRLPPLPDDTAWSDGCDVRQLRAFLDYWRSEFDWGAFVAGMEPAVQSMAVVDDTEIHFQQFPAADSKSAVPLLMLHGWPGSFIELQAAAARLAQLAGGVCFNVVVPSLPGFGYSRRPPGDMSFTRTAGMLVAIMRALGYERFLVQGGDLGAGVGSALALHYHSHVLGLHLNYIPGSYRPPLPDPPDLTAEELGFLEIREDWANREGAYAHLHGTKPHSLSVGLHDSPAGTAAWILEKFASWSDCGGDLTRLPREALVANLTLYWTTQSLASSLEFYRDGRRHPFHLLPGQRITPPCAIARFPRELPQPPRRYVERGYHVARWTEMPRGGHFAALEEPELLANDVRTFALSLRSST